MPAVMVVRSVQPKSRRRDIRRMRLRRHRRQIDLFARTHFRKPVRLVIHPCLLAAVILVPADPEIGNCGFQTRIHAQVPHDRSAIGISFGTDTGRIHLFLRQQITQRATLNRIPDIIGGLLVIRDRLPTRGLRPNGRPLRLIHIPVLKRLRIFRIMRPITRFAAVAVRQHRPAVVHKIHIRTGSSHPAMHIQQPRRIPGTLFHRILTIHTDLLAVHSCTDVRLAGVNAVLCFLGNNLLLKIPFIRIKLRPDFRRRRQFGKLRKNLINRRLHGIQPDLIPGRIRMQQVRHHLFGQPTIRIQKLVVNIQVKDRVIVSQRRKHRINLLIPLPMPILRRCTARED